MVSRDEVMSALAAIPGPDGRASLPDSGALSGVTIRDGKVFVAIAIDPARAKAMEPMRAEAEAAVRAIPGVAGAVVTLTAEAARAVAGASPGHAHESKAPPPSGTAGRASPCPGLSTSSRSPRARAGSANRLSPAISPLASPSSDLPSAFWTPTCSGHPCPSCSGSIPSPAWRRTASGSCPLESFGVKVMSIGFLIDEGAPVVWRGPMVVSALNQLLREVVWGELDVLVVDMPPGTGDTQLTMAQNVPLAGAVIVSTPQDLALIDARRGIAMFNQVKIPMLGVVENMSYFVCPHCGGRTDVFSHGGARKEAEKLGVPFLGEVPLDIAIRANSDEGRPVVASMAESPQANALLEIARRVADTLAAGAPGAKPAPRIRILE